MNNSTFNIAIVGSKTGPVEKQVELDWPSLCEGLTKHKPAANKNSVAGWLPAEIEAGPRNADRVMGWNLMVMDIEGKAEGDLLVGPAAPEMAQVAEDIAVYGFAACLSSSYRHKLGTLGPRYRVCFPLSRRLAVEEIRPVMQHIAESLGLWDVLDKSSADPNRLFYNPTCAPDRMDAVETAIVEGEPLDVDRILLNCEIIKKAPKPPRINKNSNKYKDRVRRAFNEQADIGHILENQNYASNGRGKWRWPGSTSGMFGVNRLGGSDVVWSHHPNDPIHGKAHDAFGLWCLFEHGNNYKNALHRAAEMLGIEQNDYLAGVLTPDEMLERFVYRSDKAFVYDRQRPAQPLSFADFQKHTNASRTGDKLTASAWLADPRRLTVFTETFLAGGEEFVESPHGASAINSWGTGFSRDDSGDASMAQPFVDHVRYLFEDKAEDFLDWVAHIEQKPGERPHTGWLHISPLTGSGRGWLVELFAKMFKGFVEAELELKNLMESQFNDDLSRKVLCIVPEVKAEEAANGRANSERLKSLITAPFRSINQKHQPVRHEFNAARFLICSNFVNAIPLSLNDRRFHVHQFKGELKSPDYYTALYEQLEKPEFVQSCAKWLAARDLSTFNPNKPPEMTDDKKQTLFEVASSPTQRILEWGEEYKFPLAKSTHFEDASGLPRGPKSAKTLGYVIAEAGWRKLTLRYTVDGVLSTLYCRNEDFGKFQFKLFSLDGLIGPTDPFKEV